MEVEYSHVLMDIFKTVLLHFPQKKCNDCNDPSEKIHLNEMTNLSFCSLSPSSCDGKDNNCDGMIDNGKAQLNCQLGTTCFQGMCTTVLNATSPVQIWPRNATDWSFSDRTSSLDDSIPTWRTGYEAYIFVIPLKWRTSLELENFPT